MFHKHGTPQWDWKVQMIWSNNNGWRLIDKLSVLLLDLMLQWNESLPLEVKMQEDTHTHWAHQMVSMKEEWFRRQRDGCSWVNENNRYEWLRASAWMERNMPIHMSYWYAVMWTVDGWWRMSINSMEHSPPWEIKSWSGHSKTFLSYCGT